MIIWLITIGEPIVHPQNKLRLHRTGILAKLVSENSNHKVIWWTSTFNHFTKKHMFNGDTIVNVNENLKMIVLKGIGYNRNVSFFRILDHFQIKKKYKRYAYKEQKPDIIVASFPTMGLCQASIKYGKKNKVPVIIDYRDMWPEVFVEIVPNLLKSLVKLMLFPLFQKTNRVFQDSDGIIAITDEFLHIGLKKANRLKTSSDDVFPLAYLENQFSEEDYLKAKGFWESTGITSSVGTVNICFFGTIGYQFDLETVIQVASLMKSEPINIIICGTGDKLEKLKSYSVGLHNIKFPGYMSAAEIKALMDISHIGICPYIPKQAFLNSIPGKAIEYFSSGLYVISTLGDGVLGKFLEENEYGSNYSAFNPESLKKCIENSICRLSDSKKSDIINCFHKNFNAKSIYTNYLIHLEHIVNENEYIQG
ncbi:MAG: glycosyltransferase [Bacteroidales bacterium]|nr:glycosyltransferase [Bacteroidales bacterium]